MAKKEAQMVLKQLKGMGYEEEQANEMVQKAQARGLKLTGLLKLARKLLELFINGEVGLDDFLDQAKPMAGTNGGEEDDDDDAPTSKGGEIKRPRK